MFLFLYSKDNFKEKNNEVEIETGLKITNSKDENFIE